MVVCDPGSVLSPSDPFLVPFPHPRAGSSHPTTLEITMRLASRAGSLLFLMVAAIVLAVGTAQAVSTSVVISEFRTRGPNGGNDEFVELYNMSASTVSIGGWKVNGSNNAGTVSTRV